MAGECGRRAGRSGALLFAASLHERDDLLILAVRLPGASTSRTTAADPLIRAAEHLIAG